MSRTISKTIAPAAIAAMLATSLQPTEAEARGLFGGGLIIAAIAGGMLASGRRPPPEPYRTAQRARPAKPAFEPAPVVRHKPKPAKPEPAVVVAQKPAPVVRAKPRLDKPEKPQRPVIVAATRQESRHAAKPTNREETRPITPAPTLLLAAAPALVTSIVPQIVAPSEPEVTSATTPLPPAHDIAPVQILMVEPAESAATPAPSAAAAEMQPELPSTVVVRDVAAVAEVVARPAASLSVANASPSMAIAVRASLAGMLERLGASLVALLPQRSEPVDAGVAKESDRALKQILSGSAVRSAP